MTPTPIDPDRARERAHKLGLWGLLAHWDELQDEPFLPRLLHLEEEERQKRSLCRRIRNARIGAIKPMTDFDWNWPAKIHRPSVEELFDFAFLTEAANVILIGPNGVGKSMIAKNLAYQGLLRGHTVRFTTASDMLNDLAAQHTEASFTRRLRRYVNPQLLLVDEVGYLSYDIRHADLFFEVVTRRYQERSTVVTTNKAFAEWGEIFPNAACVVTLVDRLLHTAEIIQIDGESYRLKEAKERAARKKNGRRRPPTP